MKEIIDLFESIIGFPYIGYSKDLYKVNKLLNNSNCEFCFSLNFKPLFISNLCYHGFFPMAEDFLNVYMLLIKYHTERHILHFKNLQISTKVIKKSKRYQFSINKSFNQCITNIIKQHGEGWFFPPLVKTFKTLHKSHKYKTNILSVELWEDDILVAGEIGFKVGAVYSSLSGFYNKNSCGIIQMITLGKFLEKNNIAYWDMGMPAEYKEKLGSMVMNRSQYMKLFNKSKDKSINLQCNKIHAHQIISNTP